MHDSVKFVEKVNKKRYLTSRDVGSNYWPMVGGAAYKFDDGYMFTIMSGDRSNSVGYLQDKQIDIGLGRVVRFDDNKGLPDGAESEALFEATFSIGIFHEDEIDTKAFKECFDDRMNPVLVLSS